MVAGAAEGGVSQFSTIFAVPRAELAAFAAAHADDGDRSRMEAAQAERPRVHVDGLVGIHWLLTGESLGLVCETAGDPLAYDPAGLVLVEWTDAFVDWLRHAEESRIESLSARLIQQEEFARLSADDVRDQLAKLARFVREQPETSAFANLETF